MRKLGGVYEIRAVVEEIAKFQFSLSPHDNPHEGPSLTNSSSLRIKLSWTTLNEHRAKAGRLSLGGQVAYA